MPLGHSYLSSPSAFEIIVWQQGYTIDAGRYGEATEIAHSEAGAGFLTGQLPIGAGAFKALGDPHDPAIKVSRPCAAARVAKHHAMCADCGFGIEEQALNGDETLAREYAYQQGWEKAGGTPAAHRAASMKADIRRDKSDPAHISEIPLAKRAFNRPRLGPEAPERRLAIVGRFRGCALIRDRMPQNLPNATHDSSAITTGKAMDED